MQSKKLSILEAMVNVGSGMVIAWVIMQYILAPLLEIKISPADNTIVTIVLTGVSIARGYLWRRYFNSMENEIRNEKI
jgi:membrane protein implicated in regulation of membrane protease activity